MTVKSACISRWWLIGPSHDKPLSEPMLIKLYNAIWCHQGNELTHWGLNKMVTNLQTIFSKAVSRLFLLIQTRLIRSSWFHSLYFSTYSVHGLGKKGDNAITRVSDNQVYCRIFIHAWVYTILCTVIGARTWRIHASPGPMTIQSYCCRKAPNQQVGWILSNQVLYSHNFHKTRIFL